MNYREFQKRLKDRRPISPFYLEPTPKTPAAIYYPEIVYSTEVMPLTRNLKTEIVIVSDVATKILEPPHPTCYYIINPTDFVGVTTSVVLFDGTATESGNTQSDPLGVSSFLNLHLHINITNADGEWEFVAQSRDPYSGEWANVKTLLNYSSGFGVATAYYFYLGKDGICTEFALAWNLLSDSGYIDFSATATLKDEIRGPSYGLGRCVFIGDKTITPETGLPLPEGWGLKIFPDPDIDIYAIAFSERNIQVFWL